MSAMLDKSSSKGLTPWVEIAVLAVLVLVLELVAEVVFVEDTIFGSDTMKEVTNSRESFERVQEFDLCILFTQQ